MSRYRLRLNFEIDNEPSERTRADKRAGVGLLVLNVIAGLIAGALLLVLLQ